MLVSKVRGRGKQAATELYSFRRVAPLRVVKSLWPLSMAQKRWNHQSTAATAAATDNQNQSTNHAIKYLETWVGSSSTANSSNTGTTSNGGSYNDLLKSSNNNSVETMQVTGSSYLLPTIRLSRTIKSSSILNSQLESFFDTSNRYTPHAIRAMLKPKSIKSQNKLSSWRVPIILDLKAFQHDGSPHYKAPSSHFLQTIVQTFDNWGITVIGVCNVQQESNRDLSLVQQVIELGLPVLMSKMGRTLGGTLNKNGITGVQDNKVTAASGNSNSIEIQELVKIVTKHVESISETFSDSDSDDFNEEDEDNRSDLNHIHIYFSENEVNEMPFRKLQKECKKRNLGATGTAEELRSRLLESAKQKQHYDMNHNNMTHLSEDTNVNQNKDEVIETPRINIIDETLSGSKEISDCNGYILNEGIIPQISPPISAKVYQGNVRSGQQVTTDEPNQSLIVIGNVSSGGEIMSDHDIYVYGTLRGRALAGLSVKNGNEDVHGDINKTSRKTHSKIVASRFDAELVCIGSYFTTIDSLAELGLGGSEGVMVSIDDGLDELKFTRF